MTRQPGSKNAGQVFKKYLILAIMVIVFLASMWWIFSPSAEDKKEAEQGSGFNSEIPDPRTGGIVGDKKRAYEEEQQRLRDEEKMRTMQHALLFGSEGETPEQRAGREERQLRMAPKPPEYYEDPERFEKRYAAERYRTPASAYNDINRTLDSFYEEPKDDTEKEELKAEVERLSGLVEQQQSERLSIDEQMALMERSYELAAKFTGGMTGGEQSEPAPVAPGRKIKVEAITQVRREVVSTLSAPMSDAEFIRHFSEVRNRSFNTVGGEDGAKSKNTIAAVVHGDQTLVDGQTVRLRTVEPMRAGRHLIPTNTVITGLGKISGDRLQIEVSSIEYEGNIIPVEMTACDSDGQRGIYIPGSMELDAFKEIAGNMGQGLGTTINLNRQSAGEQLLTDLGRGVIQGTSQYISKKAREVKVTLKAGYRLLLLTETNV